MVSRFCSVLVSIFLLCISFNLHGQDIPEPMSPPRLVNDFAGIFNTAQTSDLEQILRNYNDTTSTQIYVVTISDLGGYDVSDYAVRLGEKWGVGRKGKDNGAVILIKPRVGNQRGRVFIATGYGLEPVLTDARVGRIIDQYMLPYFQEGDYYSGTKSAIYVMINYLSGEFQADEAAVPEVSLSDLIVVFLLVILLAIFLYRQNKNGGNNKGNRSSGGGTFFPPIPMGGGRRSGGGFGGGFGGGGGGRFGGGGAGRGF